jgi:hypothetical protein
MGKSLRLLWFKAAQLTLRLSQSAAACLDTHPRITYKLSFI